MHMLYDSESFTVTHMLANATELAALAAQAQAQAGDASPQTLATLARHGFEIIDKRVGREVYLDGSWAEMFQQQIAAWQVQTPSQEEVEHTLEGYAALAQNPVLVH
ncbi:MAG: DUF3567 domain-containing protein [Rhodoferax sp.]|jgi:hypothetical protein|nr:DUF3567 domain-containing protein [Rhodoferax sp.]